MSTVTYLEKVELLGELFYADTGVFPPGKDTPAEIGETHTAEQRREAYRKWYNERALDSALIALARAREELRRAEQ